MTPVEISNKVNFLYTSVKCYVNRHLTAEEKTTSGMSVHFHSDFEGKTRKKSKAQTFHSHRFFAQKHRTSPMTRRQVITAVLEGRGMDLC